MTQSVPLYDAYGKNTGYGFEIERKDSSTISIAIDVNFAGRGVDEEISEAELIQLSVDPKASHHDILGLIFEGGEDGVHGFVGVGSGNERFVLKREDLAAAIANL